MNGLRRFRFAALSWGAMVLLLGSALTARGAPNGDFAPGIAYDPVTNGFLEVRVTADGLNNGQITAQPLTATGIDAASSHSLSSLSSWMDFSAPAVAADRLSNQYLAVWRQNHHYRLIQLDRTTAQDSFIGPIGSYGTYPLSGLAFIGTMLYGTWADCCPFTYLATVDPASGAVTLSHYLFSVYVASLAFDTDNPALFGVDTYPTPDRLVTINTSNGEVTQIGSITGLENILALAYKPNPSGSLYAVAGSTLYTINKANGTPATVGTVQTSGGSPTVYSNIRDMTWDPVAQRLVAYDGTAQALIAINPADAVATLIGTTPFTALQALAYDPSSEAILAANTTTESMIVGQVVAGDGTSVGSNFFVSTPNGLSADQPALVSDPVRGRYLVVWRQPVSDANDIYGRLIGGTERRWGTR